MPDQVVIVGGGVAAMRCWRTALAWAYDRLVLAVGGEPARPSQLMADGVVTLRELGDAQRLGELTPHTITATVDLGGGFIDAPPVGAAGDPRDGRGQAIEPPMKRIRRKVVRHPAPCATGVALLTAFPPLNSDPYPFRGQH